MNRQRILDSITKNPDAPDYRIAKNLNLRVSEVRSVRLSAGVVDTSRVPAAAQRPDAPVAGGIVLGDLRVTAQRPAETAALRIKRLPHGQGFEPRVLAADWGCSEENVRKHAKDLKCLKYAELKPGEWVQLVVNPETAARYHS